MIRLLLFFFPLCLFAKNFVTYDLGMGRFGDKLLGYVHAKWVEHKYGHILLYRPFPYSENLCLSQIEISYDIVRKQPFLHGMDYVPPYSFENHEQSLVILPYFPESQFEYQQGHPWISMEIDWESPGFREELRRCIQPKKPIPPLPKPKDRISVAIHLRLGSGYDSSSASYDVPHKIPFIEYYFEQLEQLIKLCGNRPLYVYLFTDDPNPISLKQQFEDLFSHENILFACRTDVNRHDLNVIEDFFALLEFDCLIRPESNFSIIPSLMKEYQLLIYPKRLCQSGEKPYIDEATIKKGKHFEEFLKRYD